MSKGLAHLAGERRLARKHSSVGSFLSSCQVFPFWLGHQDCVSSIREAAPALPESLPPNTDWFEKVLVGV